MRRQDRWRRSREKSHRLPPQVYRGPVAVAFTICARGQTGALVAPRVVNTLVQMLRDALKTKRCRALVYCFMPDHLHVIVQGLAQDSDALAALIAFKQRSGRWFREQGLNLAWQKDFYDHVIRPWEDISEHVTYIRHNPVRAGLVERAADWPFTGSIP